MQTNFIALVIAILLFPLTAFSQKVSVEVCITDSYQQPLDSVELTVHNKRGYKLRRQPKMQRYAPGCYTFKLPVRKKLTLVFNREDYYEHVEQVSFSDSSSHLVLQMEMEEALCFLPFDYVHFESCEPQKGSNKKELLASLDTRGKETLDKMYSFLKDNPHNGLILVGGTDSIGTEKENLKLSKRRARACKLYLLKQGVPRRRLRVKAFGEKKPTVPNTTEENLRLNRNVRFHPFNLSR